MQAKHEIEVSGNNFELNVDPKDAIIIERHLCKHTKRDLHISSLAIPRRPVWLYVIVRMIRFYQKHISHRLGNRCVFDPSCSRYSELAFREYGFFKGIKLTIKRLRRCRSKNGGIDELK